MVVLSRYSDTCFKFYFSKFDINEDEFRYQVELIFVNAYKSIGYGRFRNIG